MPKYEYACKSCGEHLEVVQSFTDAPLSECPGCGGDLRKVFSVPAITFKGSGFYRTDNRSGRAGSEPKSDGKADSESKTDGKGEAAKTESSPAAGGESKPTQSKPAEPKAAEAKTA